MGNLLDIVIRKHNKLWLIIAFFTSYSCIEPFRPELSSQDKESQLVMEGTITDQTGPFAVRLTKSVTVYASDNLKFEEVSDAAVRISDDKGNEFALYYVEKGWYKTIDTCLHGIPGNIYTLHITTQNDLQYESSPQLMLEVPPIDSVFYEGKQLTQIAGEKVLTENWLNILLNTHASDDGTDYFKWEFVETWEFEMPSYIVVNHGSGGGVAIPPTIETVNIDDQRRQCWVTEPSKNILVESTTSKQDHKISHFLLQSIGPAGDKLNIRYSILVKQYSINKELYNYLKILDEVNEATGGIYSKIPGKVSGNITRLNTGEKALGYFFASSVSTKRIFINHYNTNLEIGKGYPTCAWTTTAAYPPFLYGTYKDKDGNIVTVLSDTRYCTDCRVRGTKVKPDFW